LDFKKEFAPIKEGKKISEKSFEIVTDEGNKYKRFREFNPHERDIAIRLIHTSSCFDEVINNLYFTPSFIDHTLALIKRGAVIISDTNMIKSGINQTLSERFGNETICKIKDSDTINLAEKTGETRSYASAVLSIEQNRDKDIILLCGNAPTFIYGAINALIDLGFDSNKVSLIFLPVGFVNVLESKEYALNFSKTYDVSLGLIKGRFGGSTLAVAFLHALLKIAAEK
jgi:precorrin-8X/cobalt-precorrin-8 methylmutase